MRTVRGRYQHGIIQEHRCIICNEIMRRGCEIAIAIDWVPAEEDTPTIVIAHETCWNEFERKASIGKLRDLRGDLGFPPDHRDTEKITDCKTADFWHELFTLKGWPIAIAEFIRAVAYKAKEENESKDKRAKGTARP